MTKRIGTLHVDWGGMYSGKTESMIRKIRRAQYANKKVQVFKPTRDDRHEDQERVISHSKDQVEAISVADAYKLLLCIDKDTDVVAIDEAQFFDNFLMDAILALKRVRGVDVIISGLDMWSTGDPVILMAKLAAIANTVEKHQAVCNDTGMDAYISYCFVDKQDNVLVGGSESYIALSEEAFLRREEETKIKHEAGDDIGME